MAASTLPLMLDLRLPITTWLDDETFYSLCCRFHRVAGNATASRTAQQLFGHPRHGTQHDFASRINVFVQRRSDERRVGKECVSTCRSRRSPSHDKKTHIRTPKDVKQQTKTYR